LNLCLNARDAMPEGGELVLAVGVGRAAPGPTQPPGDWVRLSVRDTGIGMDAHTLENAFEPFFSTKGEAGTGLGLASVYGIVQQSGGHVAVESQPGKGTTVILLLPQADAASAQRASPRRGVPLVRPRATVLVAEDEVGVRRLMVRALEGDGHTVLEAESGDAALAVARAYGARIDMLCTDGVMPGISSQVLISEFRQLYPTAAVLVCSGHIAEQSLRASVETSALSFLPKPFTGSQLSAAVAESLSELQ
jgi:CheY-like chemotaxis protein